MSRALYLILALSLVGGGLGCGGSGGEANPLIGKWALDVDSLKEHPDFKAREAAEQQMMLGMMSSMTMEVEFTETEVNSRVVMMGQESTDKGTYTIKKIEGDRYSMTSTEEDGTEETVEITVTADKVTLKDDEIGTLVLKRME